MKKKRVYDVWLLIPVVIVFICCIIYGYHSDRKANTGLSGRETWEKLEVTGNGGIFLIKEGGIYGEEEYHDRINSLYSGPVKEIGFVDDRITLLGEDGRLYSEFEIRWPMDYNNSYGIIMTIGEAFYKLNESYSFKQTNGMYFPSERFMALLDNGAVAGINYEDSGNVKYDVINMYYPESGENIVDLSDQYVLTDGGRVYRVDTKYGIMTRLEGWDDIIAIDGFEGECVGIREDGTVCYYGENRYGQADCISGWKDISDVELGRGFCIGLTKEGQVVVSFRDEGLNALKAVESWSNIRAIGTDGYYNIVGLRSDGGYNMIVR